MLRRVKSLSEIHGSILSLNASKFNVVPNPMPSLRFNLKHFHLIIDRYFSVQFTNPFYEGGMANMLKKWAAEGFITLAYDALHQGESEGLPRYLENPTNAWKIFAVQLII